MVGYPNYPDQQDENAFQEDVKVNHTLPFMENSQEEEDTKEGILGDYGTEAQG
jgi:hypothetical protein